MARLIRLVWPLLVLAGLGACTQSSQAAKKKNDPPRPDLSKFFPADARVTREAGVRMVAGEPEAIVLTTVAKATADNVTPANLMILAWDESARRWTSVFDANTQMVPAELETTPISGTPSPILPADLYVFGLEFRSLRSRRGASDVVFWAHVGGGGRPSLVVGIVEFVDDVARLAYWFSGPEGAQEGEKPAGIKIIGSASQEQLLITAAWHTVVDAGCCPVRSYHLGIGRVGDAYEVLTDDRPWLGAWVALQDVLPSQPRALVVKVEPGSPADGVLKPGDIVQEVDGGKSLLRTDGLIGPAVIDQIATFKAKDEIPIAILRAGTRRVLMIKSGSRADDHVSEFPPRPASLGAEVVPVGEGLEVSGIRFDSALARAGVPSGSVILSVGENRVRSYDELIAALFKYGPVPNYTIRYHDAWTGGTESVTVETQMASTLESPPVTML